MALLVVWGVNCLQLSLNAMTPLLWVPQMRRVSPVLESMPACYLVVLSLA
ncbi:MAG: hypothetical protein ACJAY2_002393 [Pseudomonadales bacterium]|jgi:hypothetical protein